MRLCFSLSLPRVVVAHSLVLLAACSASVNDEASPPPTTNDNAKASSTVTEPPAPPPRVSPPVVAPAKPEEPSVEGAFPEVVYVLMRDTQNGGWFCTGTLISETIVVTAAHCLDTTMFVSYEIVAPLAANKPRVKATKTSSFSSKFADVANPDIGFLTLSNPVSISAYAELTDVTARVEAREPLTVAAVVRTAERSQAPLYQAATLDLFSTVEFGYEHGFGTKLFSNGGDSGAGLFLVEKGVRTHKLVGVARQPDPARGIDHFSRIDASFLAWYADQNPTVDRN